MNETVILVPKSDDRRTVSVIPDLKNCQYMAPSITKNAPEV